MVSVSRMTPRVWEPWTSIWTSGPPIEPTTNVSIWAMKLGIYLGNVIVKNVVGAQWKLWPNGHPVISLASAREMDVIAMVSARLMNSGSGLASIYSSASSG